MSGQKSWKKVFTLMLDPPFLIIEGNIMDEDIGAYSPFGYLGCKNLCLHALTQPFAWEGKPPML